MFQSAKEHDSLRLKNRCNTGAKSCVYFHNFPVAHYLIPGVFVPWLISTKTQGNGFGSSCGSALRFYDWF